MIKKLFDCGVLLRRIADILERSPNTVSREIRKHSVNGVYDAEKANHKAYAIRWRVKQECLKVAMDRFLTWFVIKKLENKWSPQQISGYLKREYAIVCSAKAIYKFAESRCLEHLHFWSWNKHKGGRKRGTHAPARDGRYYIDERPPAIGPGHLEIDFIVSRHSSFVLLVIVDRVTKRTWVQRLPNRKRDTIRVALSLVLRDVVVRSITTDNDIAFTCWRELEALLHTRIYFTNPYHSWEKGLVENTNRWIRCFVPKRRDIETVTQEELDAIHAFVNDRPRACIGFRSPTEYYSSLTAVLLGG